MEIVWKSLTEYYSGSLGHLELIASIFLLVNVYLLAKENIWNYLPGAVGVIIFTYIFYEVHLYADAMLNGIFYLPMQLIGWYVWKYHGPQKNNDLDIITLSNSSRVAFSLMVITIASIMGYLLKTFTTASFPYIDSLIASLSIIATILLTRKILESWVMWIMVDVIAIPLYLYKGLYITSALYCVFLCLASYGLYNWYKIWSTKYAKTV